MYIHIYIYIVIYIVTWNVTRPIKRTTTRPPLRGGGLGSRPKKMYGERLGDGVEYHLMKPTPCR